MTANVATSSLLEHLPTSSLTCSRGSLHLRDPNPSSRDSRDSLLPATRSHALLRLLMHPSERSGSLGEVSLSESQHEVRTPKPQFPERKVREVKRYRRLRKASQIPGLYFSIVRRIGMQRRRHTLKIHPPQSQGILSLPIRFRDE